MAIRIKKEDTDKDKERSGAMLIRYMSRAFPIYADVKLR